jgi:hypothetical protein
MKLPHPDRAVVEIEKLRDYCLNPQHEDGKHKARVFTSALGLTQADATWLREWLLAVASNEATLVGRNQYGSLYHVRDALPFVVAGSCGPARTSRD